MVDFRRAPFSFLVFFFPNAFMIKSICIALCIQKAVFVFALSIISLLTVRRALKGSSEGTRAATEIRLMEWLGREAVVPQ